MITIDLTTEQAAILQEMIYDKLTKQDHEVADWYRMGQTTEADMAVRRHEEQEHRDELKNLNGALRLLIKQQNAGQ